MSKRKIDIGFCRVIIAMNVAVEQKVELVFEDETGLTGERWSMKEVKGR